MNPAPPVTRSFIGGPSIAAECPSRGICENALPRRTGRPQAVRPTGCLPSGYGSRTAPPSTTRSTMKRAPLGLVEHPPEVFPDHAEHEEPQATQHEHHDHQG